MCREGGNSHSREGLGFIGCVSSHLLHLKRRVRGGELGLHTHWLIMEPSNVL